MIEQTECNAFPAFEFEYYSPELLPYKRQYPVDFFGYFNDKTVTAAAAFLPAIYEQTSGTDDGETYRIYPAGTHSTYLSSTARNVDGTKSYYGSLKSVSYPSGGKAVITWEANQYRDLLTGTDRLGAGVRVAQITIKDDDDSGNDIVRNYSYKTASNVSSGKWLYNPSFAFREGGSTKFVSPDNLAPTEAILYERVTISFPSNGKTVYEYLLPGMYDPASNGSGDWNATKVRLVSSSCPQSQANLNYGFFIYPFVVSTNYDFEQGLLSKILTYNEAGTLRQEQQYTYQRTGTVINVKGFKYEKTLATNTYAYGVYTHLANLGKWVQTETTKVYDEVTPANSQSTVTTTTFNSTTRLMSERSTTNSDGKVAKIQYKYAADYTIGTPGNTEATMIKKLQTLNMHGVVVETINLVDATTVGASLTTFDDYGSARVYPRYGYRWNASGSFTPAFINGSQQFTKHSGYYVVSNVENFNALGLPLNLKAMDQNASSVIYGIDKSSPAATVANARSSEIVFSDFENGESYQMTPSNTAEHWTGKGGWQMTSTISKSGVTKTTSPRYRFRCRAKATTGSNITLTVKLSTAPSTWLSTPLTYLSSQSGSWVVLEAFITMSSVQSIFSMELTSSSTALYIDDVVLHPENSTVQSSTTANLVGVTSATDNRGQTTFYEYDALGRPTYIRNNNTEIVQRHEFRYKKENKPSPIAAYNCGGVCEDGLTAGDAVTFTADANVCISPVSYQWKVNGVVQASTTNTLTYTFSDVGEYDVQLTVSNPSYGSNTSVNKYRVRPVPLTLQVTREGTQSMYRCEPEEPDGSHYKRTFHAINLTGCTSTGASYQWYLRIDYGNWVVIPGETGADLVDYYFPPWSADRTFEVKCVVTSVCQSGAFNDAMIGDALSSVFFVYGGC